MVKEEELKGGEVLYCYRRKKVVGVYRHYGIFIKPDPDHPDGFSVIQVKNNNEDKKVDYVKKTSVKDFLQGAKLRKVNFQSSKFWSLVTISGTNKVEKSLPPAYVMLRAMEELDLYNFYPNKISYSLLSHNCEHFATYCSLGIVKSDQVVFWMNSSAGVVSFLISTSAVALCNMAQVVISLPVITPMGCGIGAAAGFVVASIIILFRFGLGKILEMAAKDSNGKAAELLEKADRLGITISGRECLEQLFLAAFGAIGALIGSLFLGIIGNAVAPILGLISGFLGSLIGAVMGRIFCHLLVSRIWNISTREPPSPEVVFDSFLKVCPGFSLVKHQKSAICNPEKLLKKIVRYATGGSNRKISGDLLVINDYISMGKDTLSDENVIINYK